MVFAWTLQVQVFLIAREKWLGCQFLAQLCLGKLLSSLPLDRVSWQKGLLVAAWNLRSLVESNGGDARICRSQPSPGECATVDRKLDLLVKELRRYDVLVAVRKEGVGTALNERATSAWREAGEKWNAVSSRIVTADLSSQVLARGE